MNFRTGWRRKSHEVLTCSGNTVRAPQRRGKRSAGQLGESSSQRATQVILGVRVMTGKARTTVTKQVRNSSYGCPSSQQFFGDPLVGNTPIRLGESLWNSQPLQPSLVQVGSLRGGTGCGPHWLAGERSGRRCSRGGGAAPYLSLSSLYQRCAIGRQADLCVPESHPGSIPIALAPEGFLVGEPGQPPQMTPVGAGPVASVSVGQLPGDGGGNGRFQGDSTGRGWSGAPRRVDAR